MFISQKISTQPISFQENFVGCWTNKNSSQETKRSNKFEDGSSRLQKKQRIQCPSLSPATIFDLNIMDLKSPVRASKEGLAHYGDFDVLSGRGGGTNIHPGNRDFRDLINKYRKVYLLAKKNDKPNISMYAVNEIRKNNGRFLKKNEKSGLWYEIGDAAAREKTSQAFRQRATENRKLLLQNEQYEQQIRANAEKNRIDNFVNQSLVQQGRPMMNEETMPMMDPFSLQNLFANNNGCSAAAHEKNQGDFQTNSNPFLGDHLDNLFAI